MNKRMGYCISVFFAVCVLVVSLSSKGVAATFTDVPTKYSSEIYYLVDHQIITGYPDKTFKPNANVTRAEAITMVGRALHLNGKERVTTFKDVNSKSFASGYIQSAVENNIIPGNEANFRPNDRMTRGEMALVLKKAFRLTGKSDVFFTDISTSGSLYEAIKSIVNAGIANGYPDGTFKSENPIIRAEFSLLVARGLDPSFRISSSEITPAGDRVVTADSLNVRSGPGVEYKIVGALSEGSKVSIYSDSGDWVYISYGELAGYVNKAYLRDPSTVPSGKKIIAIDAGHGGKDPGAVGNGLQEKELNLAIALKVEKVLKQKGIQVVMTRSDDTYLALAERVNVAVKANADIFVSIHTNSNESSSPNGSETYYSTASLNSRADNSKQLATFIQNRLYKALGTANRGVKQAKFHVIYKNPLPSALVEMGFISNAGDANKLASEEYRNLTAEAIALGIVDYYNWNK